MGKNRGKKNGKKVVEEPLITPEVKTQELDLTRMPGWFEFAGYCLCPGTVILGPWVSFTEYAYLGVMFDQSSPEQVTGYSWSHTLDKWRRLDYTSHWVVGVMAIINWLL